MEKTLRMSLLFDFYGPLLTERQQEIVQMYFHEDLSLGEIGEQLEISRQAVYDMLRRAGVILEDFETKLNLVARHSERQEFYDELLALITLLRQTDGMGSQYLQELEDKIESAKTTS